MSSKTFDLYHDECQLRHCVIDVYAKQIHTHFDHPPKSDDDFDAFLTTLKAQIQDLQSTCDNILLFTDGSVKKNINNDKYKSAYAYEIRHEGMVILMS